MHHFIGDVQTKLLFWHTPRTFKLFLGLNTFLVPEFSQLYFLVIEFQFASQIIPQFWKKIKLVPRLSFSSKN
jgi:hypothetical protein